MQWTSSEIRSLCQHTTTNHHRLPLCCFRSIGCGPAGWRPAGWSDNGRCHSYIPVACLNDFWFREQNFGKMLLSCHWKFVALSGGGHAWLAHMYELVWARVLILFVVLRVSCGGTQQCGPTSPRDQKKIFLSFFDLYSEKSKKDRKIFFKS